MTSTNPAGGASAWTTTHVEGLNGLDDVSCSPTKLCVATTYGGNGSNGNVIISTDPTGGSTAWYESNVYGNPIVRPNPIIELYAIGLTGITCPSTALCVAVDVHGNLMVGAPPAKVSPMTNSSPVMVNQSADNPDNTGPSVPRSVEAGTFAVGEIAGLERCGAIKLRVTLPGPGTLSIVAKTRSGFISKTFKGKRHGPFLIARSRITVDKRGQITVILKPGERANSIFDKLKKLRAAVTIVYMAKGIQRKSIARDVIFELRHYVEGCGTRPSRGNKPGRV